MCGIFSYLGSKRDAGRIVVRGLQKLEYRGYDSFGFAEQDQSGKFRLTKKVGKISEFPLNTHKFVESSLAFGHTRWATHGGVTSLNAHPHASADGRVVVVHNGVIENHALLKKALLKKGVRFKSETDTEVIVHLIAEELKRKNFSEAVRAVANKLTGRFAFVAGLAGASELIAARRGSPLILGVANLFQKSSDKALPKIDGGEIFIASDVSAFLEYTKNVVYLDDEEMVVVCEGRGTRDEGRGDEEGIKNKAGRNKAFQIPIQVRFSNLKTGVSLAKRVIPIQLDETRAEKDGYKHFMLKEIMEQKETIERAIHQDERQIKKVAELIRKSRGTFLIGCGTAGKVCLAASYLFARVARRHVNVIPGSEFDTQAAFLTPQTLLISVSQSGETADVLEALQIAKKKKVRTVGVVNVEGSSIARQSDVVLPVRAGPEKAVASTKATTAQLAILTLLAYAVAGKLDDGRQMLADAASQINDLLNPRYAEHIVKIARKIKNVESLYIIGKAENSAMALEAAIKLQEVSYIHAEGFAAGELKHGPLALITKGTPLIAFVPADEYREDVLTNVNEVKARGGLIIGVSPKNDKLFDFWIRVPDVGVAQPIVNIIPIQLLAYHLAVLRKNNPDMPRNLAKSVTVK